MVEVALWAGLRPFADGQETVAVEARTVGELLRNLVSKYPALQPHIESGVSVAVDGRIIVSGLTETIRHDSEVVIMQRLKGG